MSSFIARHDNTMVQNHQNVKKKIIVIYLLFIMKETVSDFLIIDFDFDKYFYDIYFIIN